MARYWFGGTANDGVYTTYNLGARQLLELARTTLRFYDAPTGGTQYTDLLDAAGNPITSVVTGLGQVPRFQGPDGVAEMWADDGDGQRHRMVAIDVAAVNAAVTAAETARDEAQTAQSAAAGSVTSATAEADRAAAAADLATAPTDTQVAALAQDPQSQTGAALSATYVPQDRVPISAASYADPGNATDHTAALAQMLLDAAADIDTQGPRGHDSTLGPSRRVVEIPTGVWTTTAQLVIPRGVSLLLQPGAVIRATAAISGALVTTTAEAWEGQFVRGGTLDCNNLAQHGLQIRLGRYSVVEDVAITDPTTDGVILGDTTISPSCFEMKLSNVMARRREGYALVAGSRGFNVSSKCSDSVFRACVAVGFETGFRNNGGDNRFQACHAWGYPGAFPLIGFDDQTGAHSSYSQCVADSPAQYGFRSQYGYVTLSQCNAFLHSAQTDNTVVGLRVESGGSFVSCFGNRFQGYSAGVRMKADYEGASAAWLDTSVILGQITANTAAPLKKPNHVPPHGLGGQHVPINLYFPGALVAGNMKWKYTAQTDLALDSVTVQAWSGSGATLRLWVNGSLVGGTFGTADLVSLGGAVLLSGQSMFLDCVTPGTAADVSVAFKARTTG